LAKIDAQKRLQGFMRLHGEDAYTDGELIHAVILLFDARDENLNKSLWLELPDWIKKEILNAVREITDDSEFLAPAHSGGNDAMKSHYLALKDWLISNYILL
jgi:hypothetical protein